MTREKYNTTTKELIALLYEFDPELEIDEYEIERNRIDRDTLANNIKEAIIEREKLPSDIAETIQKLAKRAVQSAPLWPSFADEEENDY